MIQQMILTWESRRAERPNTTGYQGQSALHPNHFAQLLLELDATESLVRGRNQHAQVVAGDLDQVCLVPETHFLSWTLHRLFPCGRMGAGHPPSWRAAGGSCLLFEVHVKAQSTLPLPTSSQMPQIWVLPFGGPGCSYGSR